MKREILVGVAIFILTSQLVAQTASAPTVPVAQEPHHHAVIANEYVRVYKLELARKEATLKHRHDADYLAIMFGDSTITNEREGSKPARVEWKDGEVRFTKGGFSHSVRNERDSTLRNATVELLRAGDADELKPGETGVIPPLSKYTVTGVARKGFSTFDTTLPPGASLEVEASNAPILVLPVSDLDLRVEAQGREPHDLHVKSGEAIWLPGAQSHTVRNIADRPARWVIVAFKNR